MILLSLGVLPPKIPHASSRSSSLIVNSRHCFRTGQAEQILIALANRFSFPFGGKKNSGSRPRQAALLTQLIRLDRIFDHQSQIDQRPILIEIQSDLIKTEEVITLTFCAEMKMFREHLANSPTYLGISTRLSLDRMIESISNIEEMSERFIDVGMASIISLRPKREDPALLMKFRQRTRDLTMMKIREDLPDITPSQTARPCLHDLRENQRLPIRPDTRSRFMLGTISRCRAIDETGVEI